MKSKFLATEKIFDAVSQFYDHPLAQQLYYGRIHNILITEIEHLEPSTVLDVGCGTGELLSKFSELWPETKLIGLDLSAKMIEVAQAKDYADCESEFIEGSVYDIPLESESVDLITSSISSHFYTDIEQALSEFYRVLKPGGTLAMANLTNGILGNLPGPFRKQFPFPNQVYRSVESWREYFIETGFAVTQIEKLPYPAQLFICQKL